MNRRRSRFQKLDPSPDCTAHNRVLLRLNVSLNFMQHNLLKTIPTKQTHLQQILQVLKCFKSFLVVFSLHKTFRHLKRYISKWWQIRLEFITILEKCRSWFVRFFFPHLSFQSKKKIQEQFFFFTVWYWRWTNQYELLRFTVKREFSKGKLYDNQ